MSSSSPTDSTVVYALAIRQQCLSSGQVVLVRDAAPVEYSLAPPSNLPVRSIAAPASSFHAWLSVTERQAWQSVPRGTGLASHRHLGHTATQPSRHPSALASTPLTCGVLHSHCSPSLLTDTVTTSPCRRAETSSGCLINCVFYYMAVSVQHRCSVSAQTCKMSPQSLRSGVYKEQPGGARLMNALWARSCDAPAASRGPVPDCQA